MDGIAVSGDRDDRPHLAVDSQEFLVSLAESDSDGSLGR